MHKVVFYLKQFAVLNNITKKRTFYRTQGKQTFVRWRDVDTTLVYRWLHHEACFCISLFWFILFFVASGSFVQPIYYVIYRSDEEVLNFFFSEIGRCPKIEDWEKKNTSLVSNTTEGFEVFIYVELHPFTMKRTLMQTIAKLKFI